MKCHCLSNETQGGRNLFQNQITRQPKKKSPIVIKLAHQLGIKDYLLNKFVFRKGVPKYEIIDKGTSKQYRPKIVTQQGQFYKNLKLKIDVIQQENVSVPVVFLRHPKAKEQLTIIYSHGNASDLSDSMRFIAKFVKHHKYNVIVYDYTGYGASKLKETTEQSICRDLQAVIKWSRVPHRELVLWGFSLGSFPTIDIASKYKVGGVILHSPIASIAHWLDSNQHMQDSHSHYQIDCIDNIQKMCHIQSPVIIFHSSQDQLIPFAHSQKLYQQLQASHDDIQFSLIEVSELKHNQMHHFFIDYKKNELNKYLFKFLDKIMCKSIFVRKLWEIDTETECEEENIIAQSHQTVSVNTHLEYFKML